MIGLTGELSALPQTDLKKKKGVQSKSFQAYLKLHFKFQCMREMHPKQIILSSDTYSLSELSHLSQLQQVPH